MVSGGGDSTFLLHHFVVYSFFYADPGYGTLVWQLLLAGVFGGMFYVRRLRDFVSKRKRSDQLDQ
jgi:hypothetical protein